MSITIEEVKKIAKLARLELTPDEEKRHAETISVVLDYIKILDKIKITNTEPTYQVTGLGNVTREDIVKQNYDRDFLISQMPEVEGDKLVVPGVFI